MERRKGLRASAHVPLGAAALAVREVRMSGMKMRITVQNCFDNFESR